MTNEHILQEVEKLCELRTECDVNPRPYDHEMDNLYDEVEQKASIRLNCVLEYPAQQRIALESEFPGCKITEKPYPFASVSVQLDNKF